MRITLDTNVLYQAARNREGASHYILQAIREYHLELALSIPVYLEYQAVLTRATSLADLGATREQIGALLRFIAYVGKPFSIHYLMRPNLSDENDNMFVDLAFASNSRFLITSNTRDFTQRAGLLFDSFEVITPAQFVRRWRTEHE